MASGQKHYEVVTTVDNVKTAKQHINDLINADQQLRISDTATIVLLDAKELPVDPGASEVINSDSDIHNNAKNITKVEVSDSQGTASSGSSTSKAHNTVRIEQHANDQQLPQTNDNKSTIASIIGMIMLGLTALVPIKIKAKR